MDKFKNTYRIESHRKPNWDYSSEALYFLTIVTQNRICNLGEIVTDVSIDSNGHAHVHTEMILSDFGKIVEREWYKSFEIRNELCLHYFILMPNHLHAIVEIKNKKNSIAIPAIHAIPVETHGRASLRVLQSSESLQPMEPNVLNETNNSLESNNSNKNTEQPDFELLSIKRNMPIRLPKSISSFIAGFKSGVNTKIDDFIDDQKLSIPKYNRKNHFFQPNYHDHIIRNEFEYRKISNYIINNPAKWATDKLNS